MKKIIFLDPNHRADVNNPNNDSYYDDNDNHSDQLNPNNDK